MSGFGLRAIFLQSESSNGELWGEQAEPACRFRHRLWHSACILLVVETTDEVTGMFITVVAVLCRLGAAASGSCVEEIVTDSNMTPDMSMMACAVGAQAPLAKWMGEHPIYHTNWRLDRYKCVPGHYEIKGHA